MVDCVGKQSAGAGVDDDGEGGGVCGVDLAGFEGAAVDYGAEFGGAG